MEDDTKPKRRNRRLKAQQDITAAQDPDALLTVHTVVALTGYSSAAIRARVRAGTFPQPVRMGPNSARWRAHEVRAWLRSVGGPRPPA